MAVEAARACMLGAVPAPAIEHAPLTAALGRVLAEDVAAARNQPPFAASAMDGWAVRAADTPGSLAIAGESAAGRRYPGRLQAGQAVRIFTGAPLPDGADAVVIQEDAERQGQAVAVPAVPAGKHVRPAGLDFSAGERLLAAGARLDPWRLALAAAAGRASLAVFARPRIAILATGEELVAPGAPIGPDQIYESGSLALGGLITAWGGEAAPLAAAGDDEGAIARAAGAADCALLVTIGGASVGEHDLVKPALARLGLSLGVESVAIRPGKPTWFGTLGDGRLTLGLPGNPASAMVCAELFLRPLVMALQGADSALPMITARTAGALAANGEREHWMRASLLHGAAGEAVVSAFGDQDSSLIKVFAGAGALIRRAPQAPAVAADALVEALPLARF
jgi:molybdopterin molybdotransferase